MKEQDANLRLALRTYSAQLSTETTPPPADAVWLHARQRERQLALERSAYPLRIMYALAILAATLASGWLLYTAANGPQDVMWTTALHSSAAKWLLASLIAALAGSILLFRASQRLFSA